MTYAQELICNVVINDQAVQTQDRQVFKQLQQSISEFMNSKKWTSDTFEPHERIVCDILITLDNKSKPNDGVYQAVTQIQFSRIIYGTNYQSRMLNFLDNDFNFQYQENQPLIYVPNTSTDDLTSMLAFYAYVVLGMDYDSFAAFGGNVHYEEMWNLINRMQGRGNQGWSSSNNSKRTRYWLAENLNSPQMRDLREGLYLYHRQALDVFLTNPNEARQKILELLGKIQELNRINSNSVLIATFFNAKNDELFNMFSEAEGEILADAIKILPTVDPSHSSKYRKLGR